MRKAVSRRVCEGVDCVECEARSLDRRRDNISVSVGGGEKREEMGEGGKLHRMKGVFWKRLRMERF